MIAIPLVVMSIILLVCTFMSGYHYGRASAWKETLVKMKELSGIMLVEEMEE